MKSVLKKKRRRFLMILSVCKLLTLTALIHLSITTESYIKVSLSVLFLKSNESFMTQSGAFEHFEIKTSVQFNHKESLHIFDKKLAQTCFLIFKVTYKCQS